MDVYVQTGINNKKGRIVQKKKKHNRLGWSQQLHVGHNGSIHDRCEQIQTRTLGT